jgi:hypothetical protein
MKCTRVAPSKARSPALLSEGIRLSPVHKLRSRRTPGQWPDRTARECSKPRPCACPQRRACRAGRAEASAASLRWLTLPCDFGGRNVRCLGPFVVTRRCYFTMTPDRLFLAAASRLLPRTMLTSFIAKPATLLDWHRRLAARRWTYRRRAGRRAISAEARELIRRIARKPALGLSADRGRTERPGRCRVGDDGAEDPADENPDPAKRERLKRYERSILDLVLHEARSLERRLGGDDRRKLDEYMFAIPRRREADPEHRAGQRVPRLGLGSVAQHSARFHRARPPDDGSPRAGVPDRHDAGDHGADGNRAEPAELPGNRHHPKAITG